VSCSTWSLGDLGPAGLERGLATGWRRPPPAPCQRPSIGSRSTYGRGLVSVNSELRVVVVDDDDDIRATVVGLLEDVEGVTVVAQGRSGEQAARLVVAHRPDVVVIDLKMPVMGWAAITPVRLARPATRIIVLTAMPEPDRQRALRAGADAVVRKTGRADLRVELADALRRVTGREDLT